MIVSIFGILIVTAGLMILSENQLIPTISAQKDAFMESTLGNTTESLEEEELQQSGTISRKHN